MVRYGEIDQAITVYIRGGVHETIPVDYYRRAIKTAIKMHNDGKQWDMQQSAAVLLYFAFCDGHLHPSQLTGSGLEALDHAERLLQDSDEYVELGDVIIDATKKFANGAGD